MLRSRHLPAFLLAATLLLAGLILTDALPWLRGPAPGTPEWYWPYLLRPVGRWWAPLLAAALLWLVGIWWLREKSKAALPLLVLAHLLLQLAFVFADRPDVAGELVDRTVAPLTSGFFATAAEITDLPAVLREYPARMPAFPSEHARTHPPGLVIANRLTIDALARLPSLSQPLARAVWPQRCTDLWLLDRPPAVAAALGLWALLPMLLGALSLWPAWLLARRLWPASQARAATLFVASVPALLLFAPQSVQILAFVALLAIYWLYEGSARPSLPRLAAAGFAFSLATFLSFNTLPLFLPALALGLASPFRPAPRPALSWLGRGLAFALGAASLWLLFWLAFAVPPWAIAATGLQQHYLLVTLKRRYDWWLLWNLIDLLLFAGLPLMAGFLLACTRYGRRRRWTAPAGLALGLALVLILLDLSGSSRGEVGRLWAFLMPFLALVSGANLAARLKRSATLALLAGAQLLLALSLGLAWRPVQAVAVVAQRPVAQRPVAQRPAALRPGAVEPPMPASSGRFIPLQARFSPQILLEGAYLPQDTLSPGDELAFTLAWQASGPSSRPYTVFTHLINNAGELVAQQDNWPLQGQWPPTCWGNGESVLDPYAISLPAGLPAGQYRLQAGLYDARSGQRLQTPDGQDAVFVAAITVEP